VENMRCTSTWITKNPEKEYLKQNQARTRKYLGSQDIYFKK
jgi:hypothetical protein